MITIGKTETAKMTSPDKCAGLTRRIMRFTITGDNKLINPGNQDLTMAD
jgi:hypothetical protein